MAIKVGAKGARYLMKPWDGKPFEKDISSSAHPKLQRLYPVLTCMLLTDAANISVLSCKRYVLSLSRPCIVRKTRGSMKSLVIIGSVSL